MVNFFTSTAAAALLFTSVQGHMVMNTPHSYNLYNGSGPDLVQVDPLDGVQYKYPCQNHYRVEERGTVKVGDVQLVNFTGGAQHGGGSCQFSISYDDPEQSNGWNTSATFKTIYTIIGGCPAKFSDDQERSGSNLPLVAQKDPSQRLETLHCNDDKGLDCTRSFMIPIPDFLPPGKATFAWTWFNKIGNREMYMNCAPIEITGGTPSKEKFNALPNIFVANIPKQTDIPGYDGCFTGDGAKNVVNIPNPGEFGRVGDKLEAPNPPASGKLCDMPPATAVPNFKEDKRTLMEGGGANGGPTALGASATTPSTAKPPAVITTSAKVESVTGSTFVTVPSDGLAPTATAGASGSAGGGATESGSASGGGECHDSNAEVTSTVTADMTLQVTVTTNGPPSASAPASAPVAAATSQAAGGSGKPEKKQCEKDQVAICFDDDTLWHM
ncbi:hypothetical protein QBC32DRAFT_403105 [Pseudoneurospora amorphoporcata]|uniref:Lytic polysaccharide monooxygenase n=1 Tax=Pseudoneurospora amorphoporcata TaxID=241081 RepID=A0AAN6P380_9PEZI|nr:hypothetical protein QBC32DRAFT_403105 [Pseudoneurospora amorphoporcata]